MKLTTLAQAACKYYLVSMVPPEVTIMNYEMFGFLTFCTEYLRVFVFVT